MAKLQLLNALQCFEKAGQHLCFKSAAQELNVTPAAVSHQIKALEAYMGVNLFIRKPRKVELTALGARLLPAMSEGFSIIHQALERENMTQQSNKLLLNTSPSFAGGWLLSRLPEFQRLHPEIELILKTSTDIQPRAMNETEVAIRYGRGDYKKSYVEKVMGEYLQPVCTPFYLEQHTILAPNQLSQATLLHDAGMAKYFPDYPNWVSFFKEQGLPEGHGRKGPSFESSNFTIQAALSHHGVALARSTLVKEALKQGTLLNLFDLQIEVPYAYYLVVDKSSVENPKVLAFNRWLRSAAA